MIVNIVGIGKCIESTAFDPQPKFEFLEIELL
jgi:hypothetical protein